MSLDIVDVAIACRILCKWLNWKCQQCPARVALFRTFSGCIDFSPALPHDNNTLFFDTATMIKQSLFTFVILATSALAQTIPSTASDQDLAVVEAEYNDVSHPFRHSYLAFPSVRELTDAQTIVWLRHSYRQFPRPQHSPRC